MSGSMYIPPDDEDDPKKLKRSKILRQKEEFVPCKTYTDFQRLKIERMMKDPDRPISIPERPQGTKLSKAPEFVREVMGSSAAAGSGEFHVYRGIRRREQKRNQFFEALSQEEEQRRQFQEKLLNNEALADLKTAKKRQKRLKQKEKQKNKQAKGDDGNDKQGIGQETELISELEQYITDQAKLDPNQFFAQNEIQQSEAVSSDDRDQIVPEKTCGH